MVKKSQQRKEIQNNRDPIQGGFLTFFVGVSTESIHALFSMNFCVQEGIMGLLLSLDVS